MSDQTSDNVLEQISELSRQFRKQIAKGDAPKIERFLGKVAENGKETLFSSLLEIEINFRRSRGESPTSAEYLKRFPQYTRLARRAFFEPTMDLGSASDHDHATVSRDDGGSGETLAPTFEIPDANRFGEYELLRELGEGGMGVVYEARHTKTNNRVALKTLRTRFDGQPIDANKLYRFRKEFRSLSEVNHPNLVGMQTLEVDGDRWFFTMDLIEGEDFISYVRPKDQLDEDRLRACLPQLAKGIIALHQRGIVHRDLKPGNIMVTQEGHVQILDFGLVAELQQNPNATQTRTGMFVGTIPYAAPEQMFGQRTEANDWYGFGTIIYEALTGTLPFPGNKQENLLRKQQEQPPTLTGQDDTPSDLAELVDGLLRRDASDRIGADAVAKFFELDDDTRIQSSTQGSRGSSGSTGSVDEENPEFDAFADEEIVLIGREKQLAQLEEARQQVLAERKPQVVWVTGLSGEGKSSLVEKFLQPLRKSEDTLVLSGRCYDRESVPFKAIDSQIEALVSFLRSRPESQVEAWLPSDIEMLARLFPLLRRVKPIKRRTKTLQGNLEERQVRNLAFAALKDLMLAISQTTSIAMFVDDLQWGDKDSSEVMSSMLSPPNAPVMLLLGSFRSDEMNDSPFLEEWEKSSDSTALPCPVRTVSVEPLSEEQCIEVLHARLGSEFTDKIGEQAAMLFDDTQGNPYFVDQFLETYDQSSGFFRPIPLSQTIDSRLARCPTGARELLEAIAISGKAIAIAEVAKVAGLPKSATSTLTHMRSERLVRLIAGSQRDQIIDTYHDKIRETVLSELGTEKRRELHGRFAAVLESGLTQTLFENEQVRQDRVFDLAHHFLESADPRAFQYQLAAAESAIETFAMETALDHVKTAIAIRPTDLRTSTEYRLTSAYAKALSGCNHLDDAIEQYQTGLRQACTPSERATCLFAIGELHWRRSEYERGYRAVRESFKELGERLPRTNLGKVIAGLLAMVKFHLIPSWAYRRAPRKAFVELQVLSKRYVLLNMMVAHVDVYIFPFATVQSCILAKQTQDHDANAEALCSYAAILAFTGFPWFAKRIMINADSYQADQPAKPRSGASNYYRGIFNFFLGELSEAASFMKLAASQLSRSDDYRQFLPHHWLWHISALCGNSSELLVHSRREERIGRRTNDKIVLAYSWYGQAEGLARQGQTEEGLRLIERSINILEPMHATFLCIANIQRARVQLQSGDDVSARKSSAYAIRDIPKMRFMELTVPAFALYAESVLTSELRKEEKTLSVMDSRRAGGAAKVARLCGWAFPNSRPYANRVSGRLAFCRGNNRKANQYFDRAVSAAVKIGAKYEYARTLIDKSILDYPEALADRQRGLDLLESLGCVLPEAEVEYLGIDPGAHHARAAAAREKHEAELENV